MSSNINSSHNLLTVYCHCRSCYIGKKNLLVDVEKRAIAEFENIVEHNLVLKKGAKLVQEGHPFKYLFVVQKGALKSYTSLIENDEPEIANFYFGGDFIGLDAIHSGSYQNSIEALDTTSVCVFSYERFRKLCSYHPKLYGNFLKLMSKEKNKLLEFRYWLREKSVESRYATFVLHMNMLQYRQSKNELKLPMPRADIANFLDTSTETISRITSHLQQENVIESSHNKIVIKNMSKLNFYAENNTLKGYLSFN